MSSCDTFKCEFIVPESFDFRSRVKQTIIDWKGPIRENRLVCDNNAHHSEVQLSEVTHRITDVRFAENCTVDWDIWRTKDILYVDGVFLNTPAYLDVLKPELKTESYRFFIIFNEYSRAKFVCLPNMDVLPFFGDYSREFNFRPPYVYQSLDVL